MYKLIIVDDQPVIRKGLVKLVDWEEMGIEIAGEASNGLEALELILRENPHLMICDIKMPGMDGLELMKECRKINSGIKTVVLSGYNDFAYVKEALRYGVENYLLKPVDRDELVSTVLNVINKFENDLNYCKTMVESAEIIRDNILYRMLTDNISKKELRERLKFLKIDLSGSRFRTAAIEVVNYGYLFSRDELEGRIREAYRHICASSLTGNAILCKTVEHRMIVIFKDDTAAFVNANRMLNNFVETMNRQMGVDVIIGVGDEVDRMEMLPSSYSQAEKMLDFRYVMAKNRIIWNEIQAEIKKTYRDYVELDAQKFENLIITGDIDGTIREVDHVCSMLLAVRTIKPEQIKYFFTDMIIMLIEIIKKYKLNVENILSLEHSIQEMTTHSTVEQSIKSVKTICGGIIRDFDRKKESPRKKIDEIIRYVNGSFCNEMSLKSLAAEFGYNPTYLGQIFRNETGRIFTDYLNNLRLEKAKQLILNTSDSINVIGEKVGYEDSNYFYKLFKKYVGVYPTRFKQQNQC